MAHAWVLFMLPQCCHKIIFFSCMEIPRSLESKSVMFVNQRFYTQLIEGAIAQLGERYAGSVEVRGSIPLGSTITFVNLKTINQ